MELLKPLGILKVKKKTDYNCLHTTDKTAFFFRNTVSAHATFLSYDFLTLMSCGFKIRWTVSIALFLTWAPLLAKIAAPDERVNDPGVP